MRTLYEMIKDRTAEILEIWDRALQQEPWMHLPPPERTDHIPGVIEAVADAALVRPGEIDAHRRVALTSALHGEHRRLHGFAEAVVLEEYHYLRNVFWTFLKRAEEDSRKRTEAVMRIDVAITLASRAGVAGYHRHELEREGRWPEALDELASQSPFLGSGYDALEASSS